MKRMIFVLSFALLTALSAGAQGKSQSPASATHRNGPTSTDRDTTKTGDRAADGGKKEKKGQKKSKKDKDKKPATTPTSKK